MTDGFTHQKRSKYCFDFYLSVLLEHSYSSADIVLKMIKNFFGFIYLFAINEHQSV